jgi:transcriptional regulator with XRE-family HTH domain
MVGASRYVATEALKAVLDEQGRKRRWLAERIGVSESSISHVLAGRDTVDREQGERVAGILGVPFFVLFELRYRSDIDSSPEETPSSTGRGLGGVLA